MFYSVLRKLYRYRFLLFGVSLVLFLWACSAEEGTTPGLPVPDPDEVEVTFAAGHAAVSTRAPLPVDSPVRIIVYRRSEGSVTPNFSAAPYKVVEGKIAAGTGDLSTIEFTGGAVNEDLRLMVHRGYQYDFVVVVNATPKKPGTPQSSNPMIGLGSLGTGILTGFAHGTDILVGKAVGIRPQGANTVQVRFTDFGADAAGNLPHLGSAVCTEARVTDGLIASLGGGALTYAVAGMDFKQCLPSGANLPFAGNPMAFNVQAGGYRTSYSVSSLSPVSTTVHTPEDYASSEDGFILPYPLAPDPLAPNKTYNTLTIDFRLRVNGGEVILPATGVQVPPFLPGYRYCFIVELHRDPNEGSNGVINLYLSVEWWNYTSWQSTMGEGETLSPMMLALGGWSNVTWRSGMGGSDVSMLITSVAGWSTMTWESQMG